jgi:hypothetical protein
MEWLLGRWCGLVNGEPAALEFRADGRAAYVVQSGERQQTMLLSWRLDGNDLVTNQPSDPREERTRISLEGGALMLTFGGVVTRFTR